MPGNRDGRAARLKSIRAFGRRRQFVQKGVSE
jgi:hypothetical protein